MQRPDPDEGRERARALSDYGAGRGPRAAASQSQGSHGLRATLGRCAMGYWVARRGSGADRESKEGEGRARREGHYDYMGDGKCEEGTS